MKAFTNNNSTSWKRAFSSLKGRKEVGAPVLSCPALMNPRCRSLGPPAAQHMQPISGECSRWQPRTTLHHLMKWSLWHRGPCCSPTRTIPPPSPPPWPVSPAAALRWRAAGVKTPSATELLAGNEPRSSCAWRAVVQLRALLQQYARILSWSS